MKLEEAFSGWRAAETDACETAYDHLWNTLAEALYAAARVAGGDARRIMCDAFGSAMMTFDQLISGGRCREVIQGGYQQTFSAVLQQVVRQCHISRRRSLEVG